MDISTLPTVTFTRVFSRVAALMARDSSLQPRGTSIVVRQTTLVIALTFPLTPPPFNHHLLY